MCRTKRIIRFLFLIFILEYLMRSTVVNTSASASVNSSQSPKKLNATFDVRKIKSGPIFLLDKRTIFISIFEYVHNTIYNIHKTSKWFKAKLKNDQLIDLYYNNGKVAELGRDYRRENIYLYVADGSQYDITQFSSLVISNDKDYSIVASVNISDGDVIDLPEHDAVRNPLIKKNMHIFRYPKCCPVGTYKGVENCLPMKEEAVARVPVYMTNDVEFDDVPLQNVIYEPFLYEPKCDNMYYLEEEDESYMLINGRLLYGESSFACIDFMESDNNTITEVIFMCAPQTLIAEFNSLLNQIYVTLMYLSASVLLLWAFVLSIIFYKNMAVKTSIVLSMLYSIFYALHFITLATARGMGVDKDHCKIMGYVYQFFLLCSFTALFTLIFEGFYRVSHYSKNHTKKRVYCYISICAVPILTTLVSICTNELSWTPSKDSSCWFRSYKKVYYYYVPIILIIISCLMIQITTYFDIRKANRKQQAFWLIEQTKYTNMFRLGAYLNGIMTVCWLMEVLAYCFEAPNTFWFFVDGVNSLQGLAIFCAFSYHYFEVWKKLLNCNSKSKLKGRPVHDRDELELSDEYGPLRK